MDMHMDGAWDTFWVKSQNGTFIALQMKSFGTKYFQISSTGLKVPIWQFFWMGWDGHAILAIFLNGLGWPCPLKSALKNPSQELKNIFLSCAHSINYPVSTPIQWEPWIIERRRSLDPPELVSKQIEIPSLVPFFLLIPLNKLPCSNPHTA